MAKGDNAILPLYDDADHITAVVTAAVTGGRFVSPVRRLPVRAAAEPAAPATDGGNIQVAHTVRRRPKALGVAALRRPTPGDKIPSTPAGSSSR
jgi:hypothetical protein